MLRMYGTSLNIFGISFIWSNFLKPYNYSTLNIPITDFYKEMFAPTEFLLKIIKSNAAQIW
jgi:hypothetical protein